MINVFEHLDHRYFVPDAHIMFPSVFLSDIEGLTGNSSTYRTCFEIIRDSCTYIILPSGITDFFNLIQNKLRMFLSNIESQIRRARDKGWTENQFYRETRRYLRSLTTFEDYIGDLLLYWENKKETFWSFVERDHSFFRRKILDLVLEKVVLFQDIYEDHEIDFTELEQKYSDQLFIKIKEVQATDAIDSFANDADLMILADCIVYVTERLVQGLVYLVTNDGGLQGTTTAIIEEPKLIFPDLEDERMVGLEALSPHRLVADYNNQ